MAKKKQSELRSNTDSVKIQTNMVCTSTPSPVEVGVVSEYTKTKVDSAGNVVSDGVAYLYKGASYTNYGDAVNAKRRDIQTNVNKYQTKISEIKNVLNKVQETSSNCQESIQAIQNDLNILHTFISEVQSLTGKTGYNEYTQGRTTAASGFGAQNDMGPGASFQELNNAISKTNECQSLEGKMNNYIGLINTMIKELENCKKSLTTKNADMTREYNYWCRRLNSL